MNNETIRRHFYFLLFCGGSIYVFARPLRDLIDFSLKHDYGSHIMLVIPFILYLLYAIRKSVFSSISVGFVPGLTGFLFAIGLYWMAKSHLPPLGEDTYTSMLILSLVILLMAGFIFFYGIRAFNVARFPLLFLLLMVPIPGLVIHKFNWFLQAGSTAIAYFMLKICGVPVFRDGFVLLLPGIDITVAEECSGIRSSLALLISTLVVGRFALRSGWNRCLLVACTLPILIVKNGVRIASISLLVVYLDRSFLHGWLHMSGGVVFYLLGILMLIPIVISLRKSEDRIQSAIGIRTASIQRVNLP